MIDWLNQNKEVFFSGLGATLIAFFLSKFFSEKKIDNLAPQNKQEVIINNTNEIRGAMSEGGKVPNVGDTLANRKCLTKILFIDDDTKFKVVKILTNSGWINTSIIKDAKTLDESIIVEANILFVDVQGVGVAMGFDSEGLGLALALKEKYPTKKIVIYSAESKGDRFHEALRKADSFLPKNADPYEFQKLVEELSIGQ
jgi:hypothetical protein